MVKSVVLAIGIHSILHLSISSGIKLSGNPFLRETQGLTRNPEKGVCRFVSIMIRAIRQITLDVIFYQVFLGPEKPCQQNIGFEGKF